MRGYQVLSLPQGEFELARYPNRANDLLRAWEAADEYLPRHLAIAAKAADVGDTLLIVNDNWGALTTALAVQKPVMLSDSYLVQAATRENLEKNGFGNSGVTLLASFDPLPTS